MPREKKSKNNNQLAPVTMVSNESIPPEETEGAKAVREHEEALQRAIEESIRNPQTEVTIDSLEAGTEFGSLLREMQHVYLERVAYHRSTRGGSYTLEEARAAAYHACTDMEEAKAQLDKLRSYPLDIIDFGDMLPLMTIAPQMAEDFWAEMKAEAMLEFESGHLASKALMPVGYMRMAWNAASYLGIRASLIYEWKPRGGIELSLIDMMAQAFLQYQHWIKESVLRSQTREREVHPDYEEWQRMKSQKRKHGVFWMVTGIGLL